MAIVAGDSDGLISGVLPFNDLWKLKLKPEDNVAKVGGNIFQSSYFIIGCFVVYPSFSFCGAKCIYSTEDSYC